MGIHALLALSSPSNVPPERILVANAIPAALAWVCLLCLLPGRGRRVPVVEGEVRIS